MYDRPAHASRVPPQRRQLAQAHHLGPAEVSKPIAWAVVETAQEPLSDLRRRHGLEKKLRRQWNHEWHARGSPNEVVEIRMELCHSQNRMGDRASRDDSLGGELSSVVPNRDVVDPNDGDVHEMTDPHCGGCLHQSPRSLDIDGFGTPRVGRGMDDGIDALERPQQILPGREVGLRPFQFLRDARWPRPATLDSQ